MWLDGIFVAPMRSWTLHVLLVFVVLDSFMLVWYAMLSPIKVKPRLFEALLLT